MRLLENIIEMLRQKSGNDLYLPSDCEFLSLDYTNGRQQDFQFYVD